MLTSVQIRRKWEITILKGAVCVLSVLIGMFWAGKSLGLRINLTASAPRGLWMIQSVDLKTLKRGDFIAFCPPNKAVVQVMKERGYLERGECKPYQTLPLLKPVMAVEGDRLHIQHNQLVTVNGDPLMNSMPLETIPSEFMGNFVVKFQEVAVFSSYNAYSFDSRYFGAVPFSLIQGKAIPLLTEGVNDDHP